MFVDTHGRKYVQYLYKGDNYLEPLRFSEYCANCRCSLAKVARILFVEKEIGRCFCGEQCIEDYFRPTIEYMEQELLKLRSNSDYIDEDRPSFEHYRTLTLQDPDEVWLEETESGERYFTYISQFQQAAERFNYVVVCLAIEGIPSFVFLNFPTRDNDLVEQYRRGVDLRVLDSFEPKEIEEKIMQDRLNNELAQELERFSEKRHSQDIPQESFKKFEKFIDITLDDPDEIWTLLDEQGISWYTFISRHEIHSRQVDFDAFTMIVICRGGEKGLKSLHVERAFPTIDPGFVQQFRKGINSLNKAFGVGWTRGQAA